MHVFYTVQFTVLIKGERFLKCTVYSSNKGGERFRVYSKLQRDARFLYCTVYSLIKRNVSKYTVNCKGMQVLFTVQCTVLINGKRFQV